jgi:hypothetical protein
MGVVLSFPLLFLSVREQLAAAQAKVAKLWQASEGLAGQLAEAACEWDSVAAWAHFFAALVQSSSEHHSALHKAVIAHITMVQPMGMSVLDQLRCLPALVREVVAHGVRHGAAGALIMAHLRLSHKTDLREMAPRFPNADKIPDYVDIHRLIAEFNNYAEVTATVVDVEQVIKDAPL